MNNALVKLDKEELVVLREWGTIATKSGIVPPNTTIEQSMAIIQTGNEMGISPFSSLRMMAFIKGRLTMAVQLQLALAKKQGVIIASIESDNSHCKVILKRGKEKIETTYTIEDAKKAGLVRPDSGWEKYPRQYLRWRAIGDGLRLLCPDLVLGLLSPEEAENIDDAVAVQAEGKEKLQEKLSTLILPPPAEQDTAPKVIDAEIEPEPEKPKVKPA
ncbi:MAG: hypothetical protein V1709_08680, partial [Planctomycetota bacterium]